MARANERTITFTPKELRLLGHVILPGQEIHSAEWDVQGAKIHVQWVKVELVNSPNGHGTPNVSMELDYLTTDGTYLETMPRNKETGSVEPVPLQLDKFVRFQMATYGVMPLPAIYLQWRIKNYSDVPVKVTAWGVSQLQ